MYAIETDNLYKSYDGLAVLKGLALRVPRGQVYGLLGPNGSGKSTLIHLLLGFLRPTQGSVKLFDQPDLDLVRGRIGYLPERLRYHLRYSAREYLRYADRRVQSNPWTAVGVGFGAGVVYLAVVR